MQSSTEDHLAGLRDRGVVELKRVRNQRIAFDREEATMTHGGIDLHSNNCVVVIIRGVQYGAGAALSDVSPAR